MFEIIAEHGNARVGLLKTPHGNFETPIFLPVATKAVIKTLTPEEAWNAGCRGIIVNALHLYRRGLDKIERAGGIHKFMGWKGFVVSDSGGFQPIKKFPSEVGNDGIAFSMPDGTSDIFTPEKSIEMQEKIGVDIALSLDDCASYPYTWE